MSQKVLLNQTEVHITLHRLACQLLENHLDFSNAVLIGLQPRGVFLADRLAQILKDDYGIKDLKLGYLDITFYRDDFRRGDKPLAANATNIEFIVEDKNVVIIDDVLSSGVTMSKTIHSIREAGGEVVLAIVLVNKTTRNEIEDVPLRGLIRAVAV